MRTSLSLPPSLWRVLSGCLAVTTHRATVVIYAERAAPSFLVFLLLCCKREGENVIFPPGTHQAVDTLLTDNMLGGSIDVEMGDTRPMIVSPSSLSGAVADEIIIGGGQQQQQEPGPTGSSAAPIAPVLAVPVKSSGTTGYSSVYLSNRSYNTSLGGISSLMYIVTGL